MTTAEPDVHQFEEILQPIPESVRTTRVSGQFWIWAGANIAPINWVLGAPGIGLGLCDTLIVLIAGNVVGMALFGVFVVMGRQTGVTGMVRWPLKPSQPSSSSSSSPAWPQYSTPG